jgi:hypothetical protein
MLRPLIRRIEGGPYLRRGLGLGARAGALLVVATFSLPASANASSPPFKTLAAGFTQALYGTGLETTGVGVAFASNGDPITSGAGGPFIRYSATSTTTIHMSVVHTFTKHLNAALGLGLATGTNGALYTNGGSGVLKIDPSTAATIAGPGATEAVGGNERSIATDPQNGNLVFADGKDGNLSSVTADLATSSTFSDSLVTGVNYGLEGDGLTWDPTGSYLFLAEPLHNEIEVVSRSGEVVNKFEDTVGVGPDGLAFHEPPEAFLVSNNNDGSITRYNFSGGDYTKAPEQSVFASGGFRGDQDGVGPDGCLYVSVNETRYADGTPGGPGLVRICGNFLPAINVTPPTVTKLTPAKGPVAGGTTVKITGSRFTGVSAVHFGATAAGSFKVNSGTSITAVSPAAPAGTVDVTVTTSGGTSALVKADHFKFFPTVSSVSPTGGSTKGGATVTVTGTGFGLGSSATTIKFGTVKATSVSCASESSCTAVSPAHTAGTVDVTATVNGAASPKTAADRYTYS